MIVQVVLHRAAGGRIEIQRHTYIEYIRLRGDFDFGLPGQVPVYAHRHVGACRLLEGQVAVPQHQVQGIAGAHLSL